MLKRQNDDLNFWRGLINALPFALISWGIIGLIILGLAQTCHSETKWIKASGFGESWNKWDVGLEATWEAIHIADWLTTRNLSHRYDEGYYEYNPLLGRHPSTTKVDIFMIATTIVHPTIIHWTPKKMWLWDTEIPLRRVLQCISIGLSSANLVNNISIGLHFDFE